MSFFKKSFFTISLILSAFLFVSIPLASARTDVIEAYGNYYTFTVPDPVNSGSGVSVSASYTPTYALSSIVAIDYNEPHVYLADLACNLPGGSTAYEDMDHCWVLYSSGSWTFSAVTNTSNSTITDSITFDVSYFITNNYQSGFSHQIPYIIYPAIDGECGNAAKNYEYNETSYGNNSQCSGGYYYTPDLEYHEGTPSNTDFPEAGSYEDWNCLGLFGGATSDPPPCRATRDPAPQNKPCDLPWGGQIESGSSITAWNDVTCSSACLSELRTCTNGVLSGTYPKLSCQGASAPTAPTGVSVSSASIDTLNVSWNASSGATGYIVYKNSTNVATVSGTSYSSIGLSCGTTYSYFVRATNSCGTSAPSPSASGTTGVCPNHQCTSLPTSATAYSAPDNTNLPADRSYSYSASNTSAKCEFYCPNGTWNGSVCVANVIYECTNLPSNTSAYTATADSTGLTANTAYTYSATDTATKCQYYCSSGYIWNNSSCVANATYSCTNLPANASAYPAPDNTGLTASTVYSYSSTNTATKCQFNCQSGYTWNGSSCALSAPSSACFQADHDEGSICSDVCAAQGCGCSGGYTSINCVNYGPYSCGQMTSGSCLCNCEPPPPPSCDNGADNYDMCTTINGVCIYGQINPPDCNIDPTPAPTVTLSASSYTIDAGQSTDLMWNSTDASSCTATGGFSTGGATSNSSGVSVTPSITSNYQIYCDGEGGTGYSNIVTITVLQPTVSISASSTRVQKGGTSIISWSATGVTSCTVTSSLGANLASGEAGHSHNFSASSPSTQVINSQTTFIINCHTNGGSDISKSVTVNVLPLFLEF